MSPFVQARIKVLEESLELVSETKREKFLRRTFSIFHDDMRADSHSGAIFHGLYILKRVIFVGAVFFVRRFGVGQLVLFEVISLVSLCFVSSEMPYLERRQNFVEAFNEAITLIIAVHFYFFTRGDIKPEQQNLIGWSVIGFLVLNLIVNMVFVMSGVVKDCRRKCAMRRFKKQRKTSALHEKLKKGVKKMMKRRQFRIELKGVDLEDDCELESYSCN